jgi:succinyl-CoA synthetase beta subunit
MFTTEGGVEIEEVAARKPEALVRLHLDPLEGFHPWHGRTLSFGAGIADANERRQIERVCERLYAVFTACDATLCEINPLVVTEAGELLALDAKVSIDDNALFRHEEVATMRDPESVPVEERAAREKGVTYVKLDGEIGVLGNGAGLVMSTLDLVALAGGRPANFCDLGGGGGAQGVVDALEVISADSQVTAIFFNVFGGITRCDEVARGILQALEQIQIEPPIVVRFDGTNAEEGRRLLAEAALPYLHAAPTMLEAAQKAVELAK